MRKHVVTLCVLFALSSIGQISYSQAFKPLRGGERILWVGDSYIDAYGPIYDAVNAIYKVADPTFVPIYNISTGKGCGRMKEYVVWSNRPGGTGAMDSINNGNWKYVFVQPENDAVDVYDVAPEFMGCGGPIGYPQNQDTLIKYFKVMDAAVKKVNSKLILWASHYASTSYVYETTKAKECYAKLINQYPVSYFMPSYLAWDSVRADYPASINACPPTGNGFIKLLYSDCGHQNGNGMAMDAYTLYTIYTGGLSGVGLKPTFPTALENPALRDYFAGVGCKIGRKILLSMGFPNDFEAPTVPVLLAASNITNVSFDLSWQASTDNVATVGYEIYIDGFLYATTTNPSTTLAITSRGPGINYKVTVKAYDAAGHFTLSSAPLIVKTTGNTLVANGSFETPKVTGQNSNPVGSSWTFTGGNAGIAPNDPDDIIIDGLQAAYINKIDQTEQGFSQDVNLAAGKYICTFYSFMPGWGGANKPLRFAAGATVFNSNMALGGILQKHVIPFTVATSGIIKIRFYIPVLSNEQVYSTIDNIKIEMDNSIPPPVDAAAPTTPTGLAKGTVTSTTVALSWNASVNAVGTTTYDVYKGGVLVAGSNTTNTTYTVTGLTPSTLYSFYVIAKDGFGSAAATAAVTATTTAPVVDNTAPTVPTGLSAASITSSGFTLNWTASTDAVGVVGYDVYQGATLIGSPTTNSYVVTGLTASTLYSFTVKAKDAKPNISAASAALSVTTLANAPAGAGIATWDLVGYKIAPKTGTISSAPVTTKDAGITVSNLTLEANRTNDDPGEVQANAIGFQNHSSATLAAAVANNAYIEFTITPLIGTKVSISSLDIHFFSMDGQENTFYLFSSKKGFGVANVIGSGVSTDHSVMGTYSVTDHNDLTTAVTFRIYISNTNPGGSNGSFAGIGNRSSGTADLTVNGSVSISTNLSGTNDTEFTLYPNPVLDRLSFNFSSSVDKAQVTILDLQGRSLLTKSIANTQVETIDVSSLNRGVYFVKVTSNGKVMNSKFVKK